MVANFETKQNLAMVKLNSKTKYKATMKDAIIGSRSKSQTPPFLPTFEIFNHNVHNCLVDLGASSNVMPYLVHNKINATPTKCST
jgi:hypothetical protein